MIDHQQKGTALITAMVIMSILAAVATIIVMEQRTTIYRSQLLFNINRAYLYTNGTVAWAESLLQQRASTLEAVMVIADNLPPAPTPYGVGEITATLEDLQGRFNLNNLHYDDTLNAQLNQLKRLISLVLFDVDEQQIDHIIQSVTAHVMRQENQGNSFFNISQLRMLDGITAEIYQRITPFLIVLPESTAINVNTASAQVLMSLAPQLSDSEVGDFVQSREQTPLTAIEPFSGMLGNDGSEIDTGMLAIESQYFLLSSQVWIDRQQLNTYTVFHLAEEAGLPTTHILWQSIGTP